MAPGWVRFALDQLQAFAKYTLGFYEPFRRNFNKFFGWDAQEQIPFTSVLAGAISGAVGGERICVFSA